MTANFLYGESSELINKELTKIEDLIEVSKQNIQVLSSLKISIEKYQQLQSQYMQNPENNDLLFQMIKEAHVILDSIRKSQLLPLFDSAFISELTVMSKPLSKKNPPKS